MYEPMQVIFTVVERGKGTDVIRLYTRRKVFLHCRFNGRGTATSEIMDILGLGSSEKDVVMSFATKAAAEALLYQLDTELRGKVTSGGVAFTVPIAAISNLVRATIAYRTGTVKGERRMNSEQENSLIMITCNRGSAGEVMETAKKAGARGGTVFRARLEGQEELEQSYDIVLTPEKEVILMVVPMEIRNAVMDQVNAEHGLRTESEAVVCALPIDRFVRL